MAKLTMKKIELTALLTDSKKIIELIQRRGVVELCRNTEEELISTNVSSVTGEFDKFRNIVVQALEILERYAPEKTDISDMFGARTEVETDAFGTEAMKLEKIMSAANEIIKCSRSISDMQANLSQLEIRCDTLKPWADLDVPINFKGTSQTSAFIGSFPTSMDAEKIEELLPEGSCAEIVASSKEQTNTIILCMKDKFSETEDILRKNAFLPVSESDSRKPSDIIDDIQSQKAEIQRKIDNTTDRIKELAERRKELKFASDYLTMRKDKYEALSSLGFTENTFVLTGYIPEKYCSKLKKEIESKFTASVLFTDPAEDEDVPVLLENGNFSSPVESITKMYAMPLKSDVDPTPVMAFFYYLFFGMMLSDAGYGVLMVLGTCFVLKKFKLEETMKKTMIMFRNCGISTVIWGALFGSWFGDIVQVVSREFFGKEIGSIALWFEPLDDPIRLLLFSFGLGILHLFLGVGVAFKMSWDAGKKLDAFMDAVPIYLMIIGVAPIGANMFTEVSDSLKTIGSYLMIAGVVLLILTAGRSSKNIFARLFGGLYALYNAATGWLSDILSYSRLLALGLATGSIASVINLIGTMPENKIVKLVLLLVVFIVGHTANLAINLLGAYVHTDRLQFVELFSKFYTGGGREFSPLTVNTKYIKFKEENSND